MTIRKVTESVAEFQRAFNQPAREIPTLISEDEAGLRYELMQEENTEYLTAVAQDDLVGVADALGDMLYILAGTIVSHGMQGIISDVFQEIHKSNMSKLDLKGKPVINGENGVEDPTRPKGKVLKSETYCPPRLHHFVSKGIINAKQAASQRVYEQIMDLKRLRDISASEKDRESLMKEIEKLNEQLLGLGINLSDVNLSQRKG